MKGTVQQGLTDRPVPEGQERETLNAEVLPVLRSTRDAVNFESSFKTIVTSADSPAVAKRIWESDQVPANGVWRLRFETAGASPSVYLEHERQETWRIVAGVATLLVGTTIHSFLSGLAAPALAFDSAAGVFHLSATDDGSGAVTWVSVVRVLEVVL